MPEFPVEPLTLTPLAFSSDELYLIHRNRWILGLAISPLLGAAGLAFAALLTSAADLSFTPQLAIIGLVFTFIAYRSNWRHSIKPVAVRAGEDGVQLGASFIPRTQIRAGLAFPGDEPRLLLRRRFRLTIELQMGSHREARSLLRALGLDVSQTDVDFLALSRILSRTAGVFAMGLAFATAGLVGKLVGSYGNIVAPLLWAIPAIIVLMPTRVRVGLKGITLRWFWTKHLLRLEEIEDITRHESAPASAIGLLVQLRSEKVFIPMGFAFRGRNWGEITAALVWERIREAMMTVERDRAAAESAAARLTPPQEPASLPSND